MSFYAYDQHGYVGDVASIGGWRHFTSWARGKGGLVAQLADHGHVDDPAALEKQLKKMGATGDTESIRANLEQLAKNAVGVFIVSDGEDEADD